MSPSPTATAKPSPSPVVSKVEGEIKLHNVLTVFCDGLKDWAQIKGNDPAKLTLYPQGTQMTELVPKIYEVSENKIFFQLERVIGENKTDNSKAWDSLLSVSKGIGTILNVRVTIWPELASVRVQTDGAALLNSHFTHLGGG